ncbi:MAG: hypothetical protein ACTH8F_15445 [Microbacterium sp.]|uniref:hypothetical protein n=1 Tax=Microbacterium sp. TaxID=51671 RepID=UPI003F9509FC
MGWATWLMLGIGVIFVVGMPLLIWRSFVTKDEPRPLLDRSRTYQASVVFAGKSSSFDESAVANVLVEYVDAEGEAQQVWLADVIDDSWVDRFAVGSRWQIYAHDPPHPSPRVVLTEAHNDVWRSGIDMRTNRFGGGLSEGVWPPGPGSPFHLRPRA